MKRRSKSILAVLSSVAVLLSAQVVMSLGATASNTDTVEAYETKDGDASHLIKDATVKLANGNGPGTAVAGRWQENSDGTLTHKGTHNYDALLYQFGEENLPSAYEIAGKFMVNAVQDGNYELSLVFGTESVEDVMQYQMAMLSNVPYDDAYPGTPKGAYINRFGVGINWNVTSDPRDWSLPGIGQETSFAIKVNGREVELTLGTASYTYTTPEGVEDARVAWGFYIDGVDVTISDLAYSAAGEEPDAYPTKDGDESHLVDGATVKLASGNGPGTAVAGRWQENSDGTLTHKGTHNYDALLYQFGEENLPSAYEIAGKFMVNAVQDGNYELSLVFGTESVEDVMQYQMAMLSNVPYDDAYPGTPKGAYINRFGVGINWNVTSDPRDWSLPGIGQETSFAIKVNGREVELTLGTASYTYTTPEGVEDARVAWGFYIDGVDVTISDLAYSAAGEEPETYPTKDGDASHLIDGATVQLANGNGPSAVIPGRWLENTNGTLTHKGTGNYDAIVYQFGDEKLPNSYEIAGKFTVNAVQDGNRQFSLVFGTESVDDVSQYQMAMLSNVSFDSVSDYSDPATNYINRFNVGIGWNTSSVNKDWALSEIGKETTFILRVNGRNVELVLDGETYAYQTPEGVEDARVAWGFYIDGVDVTISDLYYGDIRPDENFYATEDGDESNLFDGSTIRLDNLGENADPVVGAWKEGKNGTLVHRGNGSKYNAILYEYEEYMPTSYEISGTMTIDKVEGMASRFAIIFGSSEFDDDFWQAAQMAPRNSEGKPYNDNYTNGYLAAGIGWVPKANPGEAQWTLPEEGKTVKFVLIADNRTITLSLDGVAYASYYIDDEHDFTAINRYYGFYSDGVDITLSDLYYGPIKTKLPEPTTPSEEDEGTVITRAPEEGESNGGEEDIPSTGESSLLAVIALLGAVLSLAAVLLIKTQKALGMKE